MKSSMLSYVKVILEKVSFDRRLFRKEYKKSLRWLSRDEAGALRQWVRFRFIYNPERTGS